MSSINRRVMVAVAAAALSLAACNQFGGKAGAGTLGDEVTLGNPKAKVTVVEYASASCSHCATFAEETYPAFKKKYIDTGKVRFVYREFLTPPVQVAAAGFLMARCAAAKGGGNEKYFQVLDAVYRSQKEWMTTGDVRGAYLKVAQSVGMSEQEFTACVSDEAALKALNARVEKNMKAGIQSTPTFVIGGKTLTGAQTLADLDAAIAAASK